MTLREISMQIARYCHSEFANLDVDVVVIACTPSGDSCVLTTLENPEGVKHVLTKAAATYGSLTEEIVPTDPNPLTDPGVN